MVPGESVEFWCSGTRCSLIFQQMFTKRKWASEHEWLTSAWGAEIAFDQTRDVSWEPLRDVRQRLARLP